MNIKQATFLTSIADEESFIFDEKPVVAFVGRSNVGKSSLLNCLTNHKGLAKTSSTPGRTRLINYFEINKSFYFVDLPGYGYAKAGKNNEELWSGLLGNFLLTNPNIKMIFLLVDIRHEPADLDKKMMRYLFQAQLPFKVILTKSDKIAKSKVCNYANKIANALSLGQKDVVPVSIERKTGISQILDIIENFVLIKNEEVLFDENEEVLFDENEEVLVEGNEDNLLSKQNKEVLVEGNEDNLLSKQNKEDDN